MTPQTTLTEYLAELNRLMDAHGTDSEEAGNYLYDTLALRSVAEYEEWRDAAYHQVRQHRAFAQTEITEQVATLPVVKKVTSDSAILKFKLSDENDARIGRICGMMNVGPSRAVLFAIQLLEVILEAKGSDKRVAIIDDANETEVEVVFENKEQPATKES